MFRFLILFLSFSVLVSLPISGSATGYQEIETEPGFDADWETDIDLAFKNAEADGKYLLLDFTGSDWCPPCIRLEQEVLSKDAFLNQARKNFLLVKLDFPQDQSRLPVKMLQNNQQWMKQLGVEGFPTIVLTDAKGRPFGFLGYTAGGPGPFLEEIQNRLAIKTQFDQLLEKAMDQQGDARAQGLDQALEALGLEIAQAHYTGIVDEILELDEDNHLSLREKYRGDLDSQARKAILADVLLMTRLQPPEQVLKFMDALEVEVPMTAQLQATLLQIRFDLQKQLKQFEPALETLNRLAELYQNDDDAWQQIQVQRFFYLIANGNPDDANSALQQAIDSNRPNSRLLLAKGDYEAQFVDGGQAITTYDKALVGAVDNPDLYAEIVEAKADTLVATDRTDAAIEVLDSFANNDRYPADLRARLLIHKAMILRQSKNLRAALLSENKALGLIESPKRKAELQRLVDDMRRAFEQ